MKEHPILFSGPMVRALLDGRKTQTRRIVNWPLMSASDGSKRRVLVEADVPLLQEILKGPFKSPLTRFCPYGKAGDRLWVRESFCCFGSSDSITPTVPRSCQIRYRADNGPAVWIPMPAEAKEPKPSLKGKPSIHMPRWISRITLEIVSVRVERLQDITEKAAIAEGVEVSSVWPSSFRDYQDDDGWFAHSVGSYHSLWESINGPGSWKANPWVWVVEFKRVESEVAA